MHRVGETIGPYTLVRSLGNGAFGEVWLAERRSSLLTTQVALKLPLVSTDAIETIRKEAQIWLKASGHPNVVPVLDAEVYDGEVVIASEFVSGGALTQWLDKHGGRAPSVEAALTMAGGILRGLQHLHQSSLIHRDLKPDNVLLQGGLPRLTDFGLSRDLLSANVSGNISGTPHYMAPEAFSGNCSSASDLWAVGVILYQMLTGELPFPQQDFLALILAIQNQEIPELPTGIPEELRHSIAGLLSKSPSVRFQDAEQALQSLQSLAPSDPVAFSKSIYTRPFQPANNLPNQPTLFIGREKQRKEIRALLTGAQLMTLTGSGGSGKTRLALEVAAELLPEYPDGVWLVEFAPLSDPSLIPQTIAAVLGVTDAADTSLTQALIQALSTKRLVLILDNCEHLLAACAHLVHLLLRACPALSIIATSREALNIAGEQTYVVPSLSLPDSRQALGADALLQYEAVRLFVERARLVSPDFSLNMENGPDIVSICRRLDGIPLAIELAAARIRSLTIQQISSRLDDCFRLLTGGDRAALPRQQTLRALIDWSYGLLTDPEKTLLCRLSVFADDCSLEAAEVVCSGEEAEKPANPNTESGYAAPEPRTLTPVEAWEVLDILTALADKSLLIVEKQGREVRYRLLETMRQYARERLIAREESASMRTRHQAFYIALAEEAERKLIGAEQVKWLKLLDTEYGNLRAALEWQSPGDAEGQGGLRLAGALWRYWSVRGFLSEGRAYLSAVVAKAVGAERNYYYEKALIVSGVLACFQGHYAAARTSLMESLALCRQRENREGIAYSLNVLGLVASDEGNLLEARTLYEESLAIQRDTGDKTGMAYSLYSLGRIAAKLNDHTAAAARYSEALALQKESGDQVGIAASLNNLGKAASEQDDFESAHALLAESLEMKQELMDRIGIAESLEAFAQLATKEEQPRRAAMLWRYAAALRQEIGAPLPPREKEETDHNVKIARETLGNAIFDQESSRVISWTLEQAIAFALIRP